MSGDIHERPDWPQFRWDTTAVLNKLVHVKYRQGQFQGRMLGLGFQLQNDATLEALTEEVQKSSQIEGETYDREQIRSSVARRLGLGTPSLTAVDRQIDGAVTMLLDATGRFDEPLTSSRLFG